MSEHNSSQQKKVYLYIIVLFTAAFLLILWSFLATHRSNQQVLDEVLFLRDGYLVLKKSVEDIRAEEDKSVDELFREVFRW